MLSRKDHQEKAIHLPDEWKTKVVELLLSIYGEKFDRERYEFQVYGMTYPTEVILTISLVDKKDANTAPVTYHVSADLDKNSKVDKLLDKLVDSIGIFFDQYFEDSEWNDFFAKWEESEFKGDKIYYKITRENIGLSLLADQILEGKDFH